MIALVAVLVVGCGCSAWWAWDYQQRALRVLRVRSSRRPGTGQPELAPPPRPAAPAPTGAETAPARVAVRQRERLPSHYPASVLGWEAFALTSTMVLDGTVLLACQRLPLTHHEEATMVLLIGDDHRSMQAVDLLDRWRRVGATLQLRPTPVSGAIELFDGYKSALRAPLLLA